jgi:hypothetical protein
MLQDFSLRELCYYGFSIIVIYAYIPSRTSFQKARKFITLLRKLLTDRIFCSSVSELFVIIVCDVGGRAVYDSSLAGTVSSNSADDINVFLLWVLYVIRVEASAMGRSLVQGRRTERVCVQWVW